MASPLAAYVATNIKMGRSLAPTITPTEAAHQLWDTVVVGAGPAGALAARELARQGTAVLLVDQAAFPRNKVCGCCLSGAALTTLTSVGLGALLGKLHAVPFHNIQLAAGHRRAVLPLPAGATLSRERFDAALIQEAIHAGAIFLPKTRATLESASWSNRQLTLQHDGNTTIIETRVVLAADGLSGTLLRQAGEFHRTVARTAYLGVGAILQEAPAAYTPGTIFMACTPHGYVGMVRLESGQLDVAAALHPVVIKNSGGPGAAIAAILDETNMPLLHDMEHVPWRGTPQLTCARAPLAIERVFVIGDAAGHVEPFTGEGIAWALACAANVAPLAQEAAQRWDPSLIQRWSTCYHRLLTQRQRRCWMLTQCLRQPMLLQAALTILSRQPRLAAPFIRSLNQPLLSPA